MLSGLLSFVIRSAAKTSKAAAQTIKLIYSPLRWRNIYAISSLLILFWVSKSFWKLGEYWKWIGYISTAAVIVGVIGEMISDFGTFPDSKLGLDRKDSIGKLSSIVLVLGLCFELFAAARTNQLSDEVIVDLELQASRTITALGPAMERASKANATAESARASVRGYDKQIADDQARIKTAEATVAASKASVSGAVAKVATAEARIAEAQRDAADANKIAESERLERQRLEVLVAPRRLTGEQQKHIGSRLKPFAGRAVTVTRYWSNDGESFALAAEIGAALKFAGINVTVGGAESTSFNTWFFGVNLRGPSSENDMLLALRAALISEGNIDPGINQPTPMPTVTGSVSFSGPVRYSGGGGLSAAGPSPPGSPVVIEVGLKPYKIDELK
jgi:hypothetical protein